MNQPMTPPLSPPVPQNGQVSGLGGAPVFSHPPRRKRRRGVRRLLHWMWRIIASPFRARKVKRSPTPAPPRKAPAAVGGDKYIRGAAITVLLGVAVAAAYVSYHHFYGLAIELGERHDMAVLYPAMSDGVIVMASLVMVYCSRRDLPVPVLAWVALALGGLVTLAANVAHGWDGGLGSRLLSALAPVAFVGAYELLMWLVRSGQDQAAKLADEDEAPQAAPHVCTPPPPVRIVPKDRYEGAAWEYEESLQPGARRVGRRPLMSHWGLSEREAETIQDEVEQRLATKAASNGPVPPAGANP